MRVFALLIVCGLLGFGAGYAIYGNATISGKYVPLERLLDKPDDGLGRTLYRGSGIERIRKKVAVFTASGAALGLILGAIASLARRPVRIQNYGPGATDSREIANLEKLAALKEQGIISEDEFTRKKNEILRR